MKRFFLLVVYILSILLQSACDKDKVNPTEEKAVGKHTFYVEDSLPCENIIVTIKGISKTIVSPAGKNPSCSHNGSATFELEEGTYNYSAVCQQGTSTWQGEIVIYKGECHKTKLEFDSDGQAIVWMGLDMGCGQIQVEINGVIQYITKFSSSGISPSCENPSNGAAFKLSPGNYTYSASCPKYKWSGSVKIVSGQCQKIHLDPPKEIIPNYTFSEAQLIKDMGSDYNQNYSYRITNSYNLIGSTTASTSRSLPNNVITWQIYNSFVLSPSQIFRLEVKSVPFIGGIYNRTFVMDKDEKQIYALFYVGGTYNSSEKTTGGLYKIKADRSGEHSLIANANIIGKVQHIIFNSSNELIATSDIENGSLIKINANGTINKIATNLRQPTSFCEHAGNYYVSINNVTNGSVLKISPDGESSTVVANLNKPSDILFDNHDNFILKYEKTSGSINYYAYDIYTANGTFIAHISDKNNYFILSDIEYNFISPLYIDEYNNLVFIHSGRTGQNGVTSANPVTKSRGFWKINLKKL